MDSGLNFIYGERGAGKSTIRSLVSELLLNSREPGTPQRTSAGNNSIAIVIEGESGRFKISRDAGGALTATRVGGISGARISPEPVHQLLQLDRELAECLSFVTFRPSPTSHDRLHAALQNRFMVPFGPDAAMDNGNGPRLRQQREELQTQIDSLHRELAELRAQRASAETESLGVNNDVSTIELDRKISDLTLQLSELDPNRIRLEIESLQQEAARLRLEISNASSVVIQKTEPSRYLPTLYRLLDEIDQQIREVRIVQSNVQRHRVRLKEEMEFRNSVSVDEENHPYHRAREILRQIEGRIDNADTRGDQWVADHGTIDAKQVSRFLDETCRAVRDDLQTLCDELSGQYRELRNRSATHELKELRHNFTHLSDLIQQLLGRRESVLREVQIADPAGADAIVRAAPEFCQLAATSGHLAARKQFVGAISDRADVSNHVTNVARDTSLQQQQLAALENRLVALGASLNLADSESNRIAREISELNLRKSSVSTMFLTQRRENIVRIDDQIRMVESSVLSLTEKLSRLAPNPVAPHPLLVTASNILQHLTSGDYLRVWLSPQRGVFEVQDRSLKSSVVENITERGIQQLVHLSLVLAANEISTELQAPLMLDDLFVDLQKERIDPTLETISRWCRQNMQQVIVLTQHRFLPDRIPEASVWEIEPESNATTWQPVTQQSLDRIRLNQVESIRVESDRAERLERLERIENVAEIPVQRSWEIRQQDDFIDAPVAEYPRSPLPRPYPLSKYPRTSDRERASGYEGLEQYDAYLHQEVSSRPVAARQNDFIPIEPAHRAEVVSPSVVGHQINVATIDEASRIDSVALFDNAQLRCLEDNGIISVGEFLTLNPEPGSQDFAACYLFGETLEHLQASAWLMSWVPGLNADFAQALVACGISDPSHLLTSNVDSLFERVSRFLRSPDGRRFSNSSSPLNRNTVRSWQHRLRSNRNYRNQSRPQRVAHRGSATQQHGLRAWSPNERTNSRSESRSSSSSTDRSDRPSHSDRPDSNRRYQRRTVRRESMPVRSPRMRTPEPREPRQVPPLEPRAPRERRSTTRKPDAVRHSAGRQSLSSLGESIPGSTSQRTKSKSSKSNELKLRFYLDLSDHIEAAPSIGPKTGARFEAIGVHTISDFLKITAESLAEKLNYKRLSAKVVRQYQNQTRLVCRIPNLRGHDAQLLVGCGIVEAEELASMRPEILFAKVAPFSDTKEGLKIIRNGKKPDMAEITDWISFAQHNRSLQAA